MQFDAMLSINYNWCNSVDEGVFPGNRNLQDEPPALQGPILNQIQEATQLSAVCLKINHQGAWDFQKTGDERQAVGGTNILCAFFLFVIFIKF